MATADEYASWIVSNADKKGTPEFDTVAQAYQQAKSAAVEPPSYGAVAINATNKGLAAIPDAILNTPSNVINLGKAAFGTAATMAGRPDLAPALSEPPNLASRLLRAAGTINDANNPQTTGQKLMDSLIQGGVAGSMTGAASVPQLVANAGLGAISATAGNAVHEATGNPALGISASLLAPTVAAPAATLAAKGVATAGKAVLGLTTGVGSENIGNAAKAGLEGKTAFYDNLAGNVPREDILTQAKQALANMRADRGTNYRAGMAATSKDTTRLNFAPIDEALNKVVDSLKVQPEGAANTNASVLEQIKAGVNPRDVNLPPDSYWKIGPAEIAKVDEVTKIVDQWKADPRLHTAIGLDALKQKLDAVYPDSPMHSQAQRVISTVRNAVKDAIVKQSPDYADTMKSYEEAKSLENEIQRTLSLGNKASADTALRKLQSLGRNNVNTNYGYRLELAKSLQDQGGQDLMPAIAGQAMNSWTPRGLSGLGGLGTLGGAYFLHNPSALGLLPFQSPKLVGGALYGAGRIASPLSDLMQGVRMTPDQANQAAMLLYQSQQR